MTTTRSIHAARAVGRNDYVRSDSEYVRSSCPHLAAHRCPIFDITFERILNAIPAMPTALESIQDGVTATLRGIGLYHIGDLLGARIHLAPLLPFLASTPLVLAPEDSCSQHMLERILAGHVTCARALRNRCTPFDITDSSLLSTLPSHQQPVDSRDGVVNFLIGAAICIRFGMELDAAAYVGVQIGRGTGRIRYRRTGPSDMGETRALKLRYTLPALPDLDQTLIRPSLHFGRP